VDDDPRAVGVLAAVLAADCHEVHMATNGLMALARVHRRSYDLILCDLRRPELDGPGFYRGLKRWRSDLLSQVVFLSDGDDAQAASAVADAACAPRMLKPFTRGDIHRAPRRSSAPSEPPRRPRQPTEARAPQALSRPVFASAPPPKRPV
jgi:CheY-like chemotaxis protein